MAERINALQTTAHETNLRWYVCFLLFAATTVNYMDRSVLSLVEPMLHGVSFMGWNPLADRFHQPLFDNNYGNIVICFQIAYGIGYVIAGRMIDRLGAKRGYILAICIWGIASLSHSLVASVVGFCIARFALGFGEAGNFPSALKAVSEWFRPHERGLATGIFNSGSNASALVVPALVAFVTARYSWRSAFLVTGSLSMVWLVAWSLFPYDRKKPVVISTAGQNLKSRPMLEILRSRQPYAFALGKAFTDGPWWFYLFYLPQFLNRTYGLAIKDQYWILVTVYLMASIGSIGGGALSGWVMKRTGSINTGRKTALVTAVACVMPIVFVPMLSHHFPVNPWPVTMLFALAVSAHQAWSANLLSTPGDMVFPADVSTVAGFGGAIGSLGGAFFTFMVKRNLSLHPQLVFTVTALVYIVALVLFQSLAPRLGVIYQSQKATEA